MLNPKITVALAALSAVGLTACGGSDGGGGGGGGSSTASFQQDLVDNGQVQFTDGATMSTFNIKDATLGVDTGSATGSTNESSVDGSFTDVSYFGAVDPSVSVGTQGDGSHSGEPYWAEWTYINRNVGGKLPGSDYHPLTNGSQTSDFGTDITGAQDSSCALGTDIDDITVDGEAMDVCRINSDIETGKTETLTNGDLYVIQGPVYVGTGDAQGSTGDGTTLEVEGGTMIMGAGGTSAQLAITRGSQITTRPGSATDAGPDLPVIFGGIPSGDVSTDSNGNVTGLAAGADPLDLTGRGEWGGL
ncbi:MAG: hypothetical protein ABEJ96_07225, partial [Thiohalorhabdaceae bacterium]